MNLCQRPRINPHQPKPVKNKCLIVDDCRKHLAPDPSKVMHSIFIPQHNLRISLRLKGVLSCFETHHPSVTELESYPWVKLTSSA